MMPGSWVRALPLPAIVLTLDAHGTLDGLPFMPEMAAWCGRTLRVRAHVGKTCVDARPMEVRQFPARDVYLLEAVRCSGSAHGGCERECLIFWRRNWLARVSGPAPEPAPPDGTPAVTRLQVLRPDGSFFCQSSTLRCATQLLTSAERLSVWWWDWRRGNLSSFRALRQAVAPTWRKIVRRFRGAWPVGPLTRTPTDTLGLQPGEWVRVRPFAEIRSTLDQAGRNRGLVFEPDTVPYCGKVLQVRRRVGRMTSEPSGRMLTLANTVILQDITCPCPFTFGAARAASSNSGGRCGWSAVRRRKQILRCLPTWQFRACLDRFLPLCM